MSPETDPTEEYLSAHALNGLVSWPTQLELARLFSLHCHEAEKKILQCGLLPARYQRNRKTLSIDQQQQLLDASVAIIGCGGLGGYVIEELARIGVGNLLLVDPDVFDEHNLNRQLLATIDNLGEPKVDIAAKRLAAINPAVRVTTRQVSLQKANGSELLTGIDIVVDAVDTIASRLELADTCTELQVPIVHAAIGGWFGQVATILPHERSLHKLYEHRTAERGAESELGNPAFTPAIAASLQAAEVCKLILNEGTPLQRQLLTFNLLNMQFDQLPLGS